MLGSLQSSAVKGGIKFLSVLCVLHCVNREKIPSGNLTLPDVIHLKLITEIPQKYQRPWVLYFKEISHGILAAYKITFELGKAENTCLLRKKNTKELIINHQITNSEELQKFRLNFFYANRDEFKHCCLLSQWF